MLGMMRSGTSVAAALLEALGVSFGPPERLLPANRANPTGFREHVGVIALNDEVLERLGGSWFAPPPAAPGWHLSPRLEDLRSRARALLREELEPAGTWGWKDPRTCLTLPFWQPLAPGLAHVVCVRDPAETAGSLAAMPWVRKRVADPLAAGLDLWLRYTEDALSHTEGHSRTLVVYEQLLEAPLEVLGRLAGLAGLEARAADERVRRAVRELVRPSLRHHVAASPGRAPGAASHPAYELYERLRRSEAAPEERPA